MDSFEKVLRFYEQLQIKPFTRKQFIAALKKIKLKRGNVLELSCNILYLGPFKDKKIHTLDEYFDTLVECFFEVVGDCGTLVTPTHTTQVGHHKIPFVLEETKPSTGIFAEYIFNRRDSMRSLHPIQSYCAIGERKREICSDNSPSNFGMGSPSDRMYHLDAKGVLVGIPPIGPNARTLSMVHYGENRVNPPYVYNKILDVDVFAKGQKVDKMFIATVRYLNKNVQWPADMIAEKIHVPLIKEGKLHSHPIGAKGVHAVRFVDHVNSVYNILKEDPFGLLGDKPDFKKGEIPYA